MKILIDSQIMASQKYGGISRYTYNLVVGLEKKQDIKLYIPALLSQNEYFKNRISGYTVKRQLSKFQGRLVKLINIIYTFFFVLTHKIDIYHPTYYFPYLLWLCKLKKIKVVVTIHDMIYELFHEELEASKKVIKQKRFFIQRADAIIAVSENTKRDILSIYPEINKNKITVIYEGGMNETKNKIVRGLPSQYILYVGQRNNYKNFEKLIYSVCRLLIKAKISLVCVGAPFNRYERKIISDLQIENNVFQIECSDEELNYIYQKAVCFVFPSLYEGFGIPLLEAFENSCAVACSNASCFPEICGDSGIYFNPNNSEDIERVIQEVINNPKMREEYSRKGKERSRFFSWLKMSDETFGVYKKVLKK